MRPETAAYRLLCSLLLGGLLGLYYGLLRPLRRRRQTPADLLFLLGAAVVWVYLGFGICGGDLRLGCCAGLLAGGLAWELGPGRALRPVFSLFWKGVGQFAALLGLPGKKLLHFAKILFASGEKWVTIRWSKH